MDDIKKKQVKLKKEIADLKCKILYIKIQLSELKTIEEENKRQKKESSLASFKERKKKRKEKVYSHTHIKEISSENSQNEGLENTPEIPTEEEVQAYMVEKGETFFTAKYFKEFYESRDWKSGGEKISNWKSILDCWVERDNIKAKARKPKPAKKPATQNLVTFNAYKPVDTKGAVTYEEYLRMKGKELTSSV
jgi:hypothetical protein